MTQKKNGKAHAIRVMSKKWKSPLAKHFRHLTDSSLGLIPSKSGIRVVGQQKAEKCSKNLKHFENCQSNIIYVQEKGGKLGEKI